MSNNIKKIEKIPIKELRGFPRHPFLVKDDDSMQSLVESAKEFGILTPITVRPSENGGYEIISGHRRKRACELAGINEIPAVVTECTRDEAIIMMVDSNLQRENILPSEKARAYKMKLDAIKRQGRRNDLMQSNSESSTSAQVEQKLAGKSSRDLISMNSNDSSSQIQRFIRLNELNPQLQKLVDEKKMGMTPAVEISYLSPEEQNLLVETIESEDSIPSLSQAQRMRKMSKEGKLNDDSMLDLMREQKKPDGFNVVIPMEQISKYFPKNLTPREIGERIISLIDRLYKQKHQQKSPHDHSR